MEDHGPAGSKNWSEQQFGEFHPVQPKTKLQGTLQHRLSQKQWFTIWPSADGDSQRINVITHENYNND